MTISMTLPRSPVRTRMNNSPSFSTIDEIFLNPLRQDINTALEVGRSEDYTNFITEHLKFVPDSEKKERFLDEIVKCNFPPEQLIRTGEDKWLGNEFTHIYSRFLATYSFKVNRKEFNLKMGWLENAFPESAKIIQMSCDTLMENYSFGLDKFSVLENSEKVQKILDVVMPKETEFYKMNIDPRIFYNLHDKSKLYLVKRNLAANMLLQKIEYQRRDFDRKESAKRETDKDYARLSRNQFVPSEDVIIKDIEAIVAKYNLDINVEEITKEAIINSKDRKTSEILARIGDRYKERSALQSQVQAEPKKTESLMEIRDSVRKSMLDKFETLINDARTYEKSNQKIRMYDILFRCCSEILYRDEFIDSIIRKSEIVPAYEHLGNESIRHIRGISIQKISEKSLEKISGLAAERIAKAYSFIADEIDRKTRPETLLEDVIRSSAMISSENEGFHKLVSRIAGTFNMRYIEYKNRYSTMDPGNTRSHNYHSLDLAVDTMRQSYAEEIATDRFKTRYPELSSIRPETILEINLQRNKPTSRASYERNTPNPEATVPSMSGIPITRTSVARMHSANEQIRPTYSAPISHTTDYLPKPARVEVAETTKTNETIETNVTAETERTSGKHSNTSNVDIRKTNNIEPVTAKSTSYEPTRYESPTATPHAIEVAKSIHDAYCTLSRNPAISAYQKESRRKEIDRAREYLLNLAA